MSSTNAPYATLHDLPKYEKRADVAGAPWCKDQTPVQYGRGHDPEPYITCNSRTAPFATFHNIPKATENLPLTKGSQLPPEQKFITPYGTSENDHHPTQPNKSMVNHQAPWDRDDVQHKAQQRFPHGEDAHYTSSHAPYATDST